MAESAFVVIVPGAEPRVGRWRARFDASASLDMPAHVTILAPFMAPGLVTDDVVRQVRDALAGVASFAFTLSAIGRFPTTAWLAPEPAAPFIALTQRLASAFPEFPPFGGVHDTIVPHLTVAHGTAAAADVVARTLADEMRENGPIEGVCRVVTLVENASGRWRPLHPFSL